ncbi:glutamate racemase [Lachnospiraceae bacterium KGMB03038]|nr:glutamate racemase [Lachnospiraceae bacterium KGMB03038]
MDRSGKKGLPIGFMDSGLGGLSVLREAVRIMPYDDFIYYGDSKNAPYGVKDQETIRRLTFHVVEMLLERGIKGLAIACNTATSAAVAKLRILYPNLPIVGIEPAVKPAVEQNHGGRILVMATPMTIRQEKFHRLLERHRNGKEVIPVPCAGLMEFVEHGELDGDTLEAYFEEHLTPYLTEDTETIVLGCTHYPFLKGYLKKFLGDRKIALIDGSLGTAMELRRRLLEQGLICEEKRDRKIIIENSLEDPDMIDRSWRLLNLPID